MTSIVDTNVILVANGQHDGVESTCVEACALRLESIMQGGRIALDHDFEILHEYQKKTNHKTGNLPGDAFVKWALRNRVTSTRCDLIELHRHPKRGYDSFPDDERIAKFDPPDRKFVAVAAAHPKKPPILQAADSKWLDWAPALEDHGIDVEFICRDDIKRFRDNKAQK